MKRYAKGIYRPNKIIILTKLKTLNTRRRDSPALVRENTAKELSIETPFSVFRKMCAMVFAIYKRYYECFYGQPIVDAH
jgi:hypothetical protein